MECLVLTKEILISITALIGSIVAICGLFIWKSQLKGKITFDLSRRLLTNTFLLREAINMVRNPVMLAIFSKSAPDDSPYSKNPEGESYYFQLTAYQSRFQYLNDIKSNLNSDIFESEVFWGKEIRNVFDELFLIINRLTITIHWYLERKNPLDMSDIAFTNDELKVERNIMYRKNDSSIDEFENQVNDTITKIESLLRPHLVKFK